MVTQHRPNPPSSIIIDGKSGESGTVATKIMDGRATISALLSDRDTTGKTRLVTRISSSKKFTRYWQSHSGWYNDNKRATLVQTRLASNTLYYGRAYAQDTTGRFSSSYNSFQFWTNRYPAVPTLVNPPENSSFSPADPIYFDWHHLDPDASGDPQGAFRFEVRNAGTSLAAPGAWSIISQTTKNTFITRPANTYRQSVTYEWRVRTRDVGGFWSPYSLVRSFYVIGTTKAPKLLSPARGAGLVVEEDLDFSWQFIDPSPGAVQGNADFRYRVVGTDDSSWVYIYGSALTEHTLTVPADTFLADFNYEWQVRTVRASGTDPTSDWSASSTFWSILTPGTLSTDAFPLGEAVRGQLGCGTYRVLIYERGGKIQRGEITSVSSLTWHRKRDDISDCTFTVDGYDYDCGQLLGQLRSWRYEVVIMRDDERVWEGPITHLTYTPGQVIVQAKDVMAYLYRRIMRQGYNDSYRKIAGKVQAVKSVVERAGLVTVNALAPADPNVLPYLTMIQSGTDAGQRRIVGDYTKTAWEEIDDLAAHAGLDYTTVGRRIMYWDTHRPLGQLIEMHDNDFSEPLTVTEYGMTLANYFGVTDGQGNWGAAIPTGLSSSNISPNYWTKYYGPIEQLANQYAATTTTDATTPAAVAQVKSDLSTQAKRNINGRYPAPLVARVPDNATIQPTVNVAINQLVPGVWIPLRVSATVRPCAQMQKLDSIQVTVDANGERVGVVMSPAPFGEADPDDNATEAGSGEAQD